MSVGRCRLGVLSVLAACLTGPVIAAPSGDPILIGVMGGTTGAYGNVGTQAQQGALVAQEKLTAQGGILGRPVVVEAVNDNGDGTLAGRLFQKFVSKGAVAIVGSPDNGPVTAQLADRYHIPDIGLVDGGGLTVYPDGPDKPAHHWVFQSGGNSFAWGAAMGDYALKHCPKGLAVLHDTTSWGMGGIAAFKQVYEKAGKKITLDRPITENWTTGATAQLTPELEAVKNSGADCVEVWLSPPDQAAFAQILRTSGEHLLLLGESDTCSDNVFANLAGPAADGVVCAQITAELHPNDLYKEFADAYRKKYNEDPTQSAEVTYQAIMTLAHVIEQTKSTDHAVLRDAFEKLSGYPGIDGEVTFSPTRHVSFTAQELTLVKYDAASKKWVEFHE
jgi:branched-chain amino acid transport system substrate-binding protein